MPHLIVASKNPVKINAAKAAFERAFPDQSFTVTGVAVLSGVPDQPRSDAETHRGAINRAKAALSNRPDGDFFVGMEGGVEKLDHAWRAFAWMVVMDKSGKMGMGRTGEFILPQAIGELLDTGMELGPADDQVFGLTNSKQSRGAVGILTNGVIDRAKYYEPALVFALIPWLRPDLYPSI